MSLQVCPTLPSSSCCMLLLTFKNVAYGIPDDVSTLEKLLYETFHGMGCGY